MSDQPGKGFGVSARGVEELGWALGGSSLADAFPAAVLAPAWRALLERGVIETPSRVAAGRIEVLVVAPNALELRVPIRSRNGEFVKVVPVWVEAWPAAGDVAGELAEAAKHLAEALAKADAAPTFDIHPGTGQKPHN